MNTAQVLSQQSLLVLEGWIRSRIGISYLDHRLGLLAMRVTPRLEALGLRDYQDYLWYLQFHPERQEELQILISKLTNNETYLFRERAQLDYVVETLVPEMLKIRSNVRIGSAGCSSGEEAVSLACLWSKLAVGDFESVEIFGLDIDLSILAKARAGVYGSNSFRGVDPLLQHRFFDATSDGFRPKDHIRQRLQFRWANLMEDNTLGPRESYDIMLCRNVLIYFTDEGKARVVRNLYDRLRPGGVLLVGMSETLAQSPYEFEPQRHGPVLIYRKPND